MDMPQKKNEQQILYYKEKPLIRRGNLIYYGNPADPYIIMFIVEDAEKVNDLDVATRVTVQLQTNKGTGKEKVLKKAERDGLYAAMDIGEFWLSDILASE